MTQCKTTFNTTLLKCKTQVRKYLITNMTFMKLNTMIHKKHKIKLKYKTSYEKQTIMKHN